MSWPCLALPGLAQHHLAWLGLALFDLALLVMAWLWPESGMCQIRIGLDTGDHVFLLLRFVLLAFARLLPSSQRLIHTMCLFVFSFSFSFCGFGLFLWAKVNAISLQSSQSLLSHYGDSESEGKWLSGRINLVLFFFTLLHSHTPMQTFSVLVLWSVRCFYLAVTFTCFLSRFFLLHSHHCE